VSRQGCEAAPGFSADAQIATMDVRTGEQTILDYLIQPLNRAKEARVSSHAKYL